MEIREGIKYRILNKESKRYYTIAEVRKDGNKFFGMFDNGETSTSEEIETWINYFKFKAIELVYYPYKTGDWVVNKLGVIFQIKENHQAIYKQEYYRPAFKEEIPINNMENKTNKIVIHNNIEIVEEGYYYTEWEKNKSAHIFKIKKLEASKFLSVSVYGSICVDANSFDYTSKIFHAKYLKNIRKATTDEIEWLDLCIKNNKFMEKPDEKINNDIFEIGAWYKCFWKVNNNTIYIKPTSKDNVTITCLGKNSIWPYYLDFIYEDGSYFKEKLLNPEKLKTLDEIQKYLPENHEDKIKHELVNFKKQDSVLETKYWRCTGVSYDFTKGKIYKLRDDKKITDSHCFIDDTNRSNGFSIDNIKFFEPATESDFLNQELKNITNNKTNKMDNFEEYEKLLAQEKLEQEKIKSVMRNNSNIISNTKSKEFPHNLDFSSLVSTGTLSYGTLSYKEEKNEEKIGSTIHLIKKRSKKIGYKSKVITFR